ncbi:MAG: AI-2E family transporter [Eggerthellaceae bacterium]|nr:AI-2E family transporter [Eggerthellaceae bacterium]
MALLGGSNKEQTKEQKARLACFRVWTAVGLIAIVFVLGYVLNVLATPVAVIIWTVVIVFCLRSPVNRLEKIGVHRMAGTIISYIGMFVVLGGLAALLSSPVFGIGAQFSNLGQNIPTYFQQATDFLDRMNSSYFAFLQNDVFKGWVDQAASALTAWLSQAAKGSADALVAVGSSVFNSFIIIGFALVVAFWILMELPAIGRELKRLLAGKHEQDVEMLYATFTRVMGGYVKATLVQCLLIGAGCTIAYAIMGIPYAAALGVTAGILNIIPVVGPWLGGALAAIVGVFVSPLIALIALLVTIVIQQLIYTFVSPKLMADSVNIHPALVILAMLTGLAIGGEMSGLMGSLVGMLASIPAVAALKSVFVYYFEKKTGQQIIAPDGVFFKGTPSGADGSPPDPLADAEEIPASEKHPGKPTETKNEQHKSAPTSPPSAASPTQGNSEEAEE